MPYLLPLVQHCESILFQYYSFSFLTLFPLFFVLVPHCSSLFVCCIIPIVHLFTPFLLTVEFSPLIPSSYLCQGPFFCFKTYSDWLSQPKPLALPGWEPCLQRLKLVPAYGALFLVVNAYFPLPYVRTDEFLDQNFFYRYLFYQHMCKPEQFTHKQHTEMQINFEYRLKVFVKLNSQNSKDYLLFFFE